MTCAGDIAILKSAFYSARAAGHNGGSHISLACWILLVDGPVVDCTLFKRLTGNRLCFLS